MKIAHHLVDDVIVSGFLEVNLPSPNGHIQATGLDARGWKQYRYHSKWRELRDQDNMST